MHDDCPEPIVLAELLRAPIDRHRPLASEDSGCSLAKGITAWSRDQPHCREPLFCSRAEEAHPGTTLGAVQYVVYGPPDAERRELSLAPQLESWEKSGHPSQKRLAEWLSHVRAALDLPPAREALAIELEVGFPGWQPLIGGGRDLDNFLLPVVRDLGPGRFVSAWVRKVHARSTIRVAPAQPILLDAPGWSFAAASTSVSSATTAWKTAVERQVADQAPPVLSHGPIEVHLSFRVSAGRNWALLWKPAIDALGPILGSHDPRPFHPRDDRIVTLGLHRVVDPSFGWSVHLGLWWRAVTAREAR